MESNPKLGHAGIMPAVRALYLPLTGKINIERYEIIDPNVQQHGDIAVLSYKSYQSCEAGKRRIRRRSLVSDSGLPADFREMDDDPQPLVLHEAGTQKTNFRILMGTRHRTKARALGRN